MRDGKVAVCEMVPVVRQLGGGLSVVERQPQVVCSLDETSGIEAFATVLAHRLRREHHDFMRMVHARQNRERMERMKEVRQRAQDLRRKIEDMHRGRIWSIGR